MLKKFRDHLDGGVLLITGITFLLFALALFSKGFTEELLLEVAVFLISVKLILSTYHLTVLSKRIEKKIDKIENDLNK